MSLAPVPFAQCPKCTHAPLPQDQSLPAACPGCGVILAKIGARPLRAPSVVNAVADALARAGKVDAARSLQMPLTPLKLWELLKG